MTFNRAFKTLLLTVAVAGPMPLLAQSNSTEVSAVVLAIPLNLSQLRPDIEKVRLLCLVSSADGNTRYSPELDVGANGQVNTVARVLIVRRQPYNPNNSATPVPYQCSLNIYVQGQWHNSLPLFGISVTPAPTVSGSFTWQ